MRNYLLFESEFDRLRDYFLLESSDPQGDDDLAEATNEDSGDNEESGDAEADGGKDKESAEESGESGESGESTQDDGLDLGDLTGDEGMSQTPDKVNAQPAQAPGAINPKQLIVELTQGEDNIYDRVVAVARTKFPNCQCQLKDLLPIIAEGVTKFMENRKYIKLSGDAMKAVCLNIARGLKERCDQSGKKASPVQESAFTAALPIYETQSLTEGWKELLLAGGLAAAGANAATAQSAPQATLNGTPRYVAMQQQQQTPGKQQVARKQAAKGAPGVATVPSTANPKSVRFSKDSTYRMTPDEYAKFKDAGNLPASYQVKKADQPSSPGKPSQTQKAVKEQAKAGKTTGQLAKGNPAKSEAPEKCQVPPDEKESSIDVGETLHGLAHDAVDVGFRGAKTLWGGLKGAVGGAWKKGKEAWEESGRTQEHEHDKMIAERNAKK